MATEVHETYDMMQSMTHLWPSILSYLPLTDLLTCRTVSVSLRAASYSPLITGHKLVVRTRRWRSRAAYQITTRPQAVRCIAHIDYHAWADDKDGDDVDEEMTFWRVLADACTDHSSSGKRLMAVSSLILNVKAHEEMVPDEDSWPLILRVPGLSHITIGSWPSWPGIGQSHHTAWAEVNPGLQVLHIRTDHTVGQQLLDVLPMFTELHTLTIDEHPRWKFGNVKDYTPLAQCTSLKHLTVGIQTWHTSTTLLPAIAKLSLHTLDLMRSMIDEASWLAWMDDAVHMHQTLVCLTVSPGRDTELTGLHRFQQLTSLTIPCCRTEILVLQFAVCLVDRLQFCNVWRVTKRIINNQVYHLCMSY